VNVSPLLSVKLEWLCVD